MLPFSLPEMTGDGKYRAQAHALNLEIVFVLAGAKTDWAF